MYADGRGNTYCNDDGREARRGEPSIEVEEPSLLGTMIVDVF
jgi:hypothetical protein